MSRSSSADQNGGGSSPDFEGDGGASRSSGAHHADSDSAGTPTAGSPHRTDAETAASHEAAESAAPKRGTGRRVLGVLGKILGILLATLGAILLASSFWILRTFGPINVNQLFANIPKGGGEEGADGDPAMIRSFVIEAVIIPLLILIALAIFYYVAVHKIRERSPNSGFNRYRPWLSAVLALALFIAGVTHFSSTISLPTYIRGILTNESLANYYVSPAIESRPEEPKNLVVIYLESMDDAFSQEDVMGENLVESLDEATAGWESIDNLEISPYYGYTIAGIVSTQCGIPPKPADGMIMTDEEPGIVNDIAAGKGSFMHSTVCLGDILKQDGYNNVYMGGASTAFAGKGLFLNSHGFDTVYGRTYWTDNGETEVSDWGLSDRRLFEHAKDQVKILHDAGQPFTFSAITLDNHAPIKDFGYCEGTEDDIERATIRCQADIVADFVDYMEDEGILEDTVVVLMADHLLFTPSPIADFKKDMSQTEQQRQPLYNRIWTPDGVEFARDSGFHTDMYPTILELLGYRIEDHRAGIGVSFQASEEEVAGKGTILDLSYDEAANVFNSSSSDLYQELWKPRG